MRRILVAVACGTLLGCLVTRTTSAATARSGNPLTVQFDAGDVIGNYDHMSASNLRTNVDWTTTMFFRGNATITKVKNILGSTYGNTGATMRELVNDGAGNVWDSDNGRKDAGGCNSSDSHMRIYADGDDRLYNPTDLFYVVASTHYDFNDVSGCGEYFGWSENASAGFYNFFRNKGYSGSANAVAVSNAEPFRVEGNHYWQSDGNLHRITLP